MKQILSKINYWNLGVGMLFGFIFGVCLVSFLVPSGLDMIRVYHMEQYRDYKNGTMMMNHTSSSIGNKYMMGTVTSEKQFVEDMIEHHEAAVIMAKQVLMLNPRADIKALAEDIITAQTGEIKMMKGWLINWK